MNILAVAAAAIYGGFAVMIWDHLLSSDSFGWRGAEREMPVWAGAMIMAFWLPALALCGVAWVGEQVKKRILSMRG